MFVGSADRQETYLTVTVAPAASSFALASSAASLPTFSSSGFGALSTRSLASLRPRPETISRTTLMTPIFFSPTPSRMTSNSDCSSTASAGAAAAPGAAATATGAAAVTSKVSSNFLTNSESSSSVSSLNASSRSSVDSLAMVWSFLILLLGYVVDMSWILIRTRLRRLFGCLLLLQRSCQPGDLRRRSVEQAGGLRQVRLHRAGQLGQQHLARLQVGDLVDLGHAQRAAVHVAALDDQRLVILGEGLQRLGGVDGLTLDERDRSRTDEELVETIDARLGRGTLDQRVLGDRIGGGVTERPAQILEVGDGQP